MRKLTAIRRDDADHDANGATVRKTYQYKLLATPAQERALETVLWRVTLSCVR